MASGSLEALMFAHGLLHSLWRVLCDPRMMLVKSWLEKLVNLINRQEQVKEVISLQNIAVRNIILLLARGCNNRDVDQSEPMLTVPVR